MFYDDEAPNGEGCQPVGEAQYQARLFTSAQPLRRSRREGRLLDSRCRDRLTSKQSKLNRFPSDAPRDVCSMGLAHPLPLQNRGNTHRPPHRRCLHSQVVLVGPVTVLGISLWSCTSPCFHFQEAHTRLRSWKPPMPLAREILPEPRLRERMLCTKTRSTHGKLKYSPEDVQAVGKIGDTANAVEGDHH